MYILLNVIAGKGPMEKHREPIYDDDVNFKKNTTRVAQNLILHKNADQPRA
jgi:hypothetical protein